MLEVVFAVALLVSPAQDQQQVGEDANQNYDYPAGWSGENWEDDPTAPPPDPEFTIRPNVGRTVVGRSGGNVTIRFTGPTVTTVRPPWPVSGGPRTLRLPAGAEYTGPDVNQNDIPDDLERRDVDVRNG